MIAPPPATPGSTGSTAAGENTKAVHPPTPGRWSQVPLALPLHRSTTFAFPTAAEYAAVLADTAEGYTYQRMDSPTADAFAQALAALEGDGVGHPVVGQAFASGMAAISTVLMTLTGAGRHVVAARELYGGTFGLLTGLLPRFGVTATFVDTADLDAVRGALRPETALIWTESLANPTMSVADLPGLSAIAHDAGIPLVVDATFATPAVCRPLRHGADLVVHSATKYIGGHSDVTGGVVAGAPELLAPIRLTRMSLGGSLSPDDAYMLHRGLQTLPLRMGRHCAVALAVAEGLEGHERLVRVDYPGLASHRDHALAGKLFDHGRYGAVVTITPSGGRAAGMAFCDALRLVAVATSLGGTHSMVSHVASTTHRQFSDAELAAAGIDPAAVRISIGLEDADDLLADLIQALDALG